jgi:hypothetical protein
MGSVRAREHAAGALASLGLDNKANQVVLTQLLVELLINGNREAQERAVKALNALVKENTSAHEVIAQAGNPAQLVALLKSSHLEAKDYALWALSLSIEKKNQSIISEAGGVQPLIQQLSDARVFIKEQAASALAKLAWPDAPAVALAVEAGVILVGFAAGGSAAGLITREDLAAIKPDALLVNTARAGVIAPGALIEALKAGRPGSAALDVFDPEPPLPDNPLLTLPNVVVTMHIASFTEVGTDSMGNGVVDQLAQLFRGERPDNLLDGKAWPGRAASIVN